MCPVCHEALGLDHVGRTEVELCSRCGGSLVRLAAVHAALHEDIRDALLAVARSTRSTSSLACPVCLERMTLVSIPRGTEPVLLNVCYRCSHAWFNSREAAALTSLYGTDIEHPRSADRKWKIPLAVLGVPLEEHSVAMLHRPWFNWGLALMVAVVSEIAWKWPALYQSLELVPDSMWRAGGLNLITVFFVHGTAFHLLSNLYFLLVFGDKVEDYLGRTRYCMLLLAATLAGSFAHCAFSPNPSLPAVGASGGISGLVVFYGLTFPRARLFILLIPIYLRFSARTGLLVWIAVQAAGAIAQMTSGSSTSYLAHLGGACVGFALWQAWRIRLTSTRSRQLAEDAPAST